MGAVITKDNKGFSLVEVLIAIVLTLVVVTGVYKLYYQFEKSVACDNLEVTAQQKARVALEMLFRDISLTGYDVPSKFPITKELLPSVAEAKESEITFRFLDPDSPGGGLRRMLITYKVGSGSERPLEKTECLTDKNWIVIEPCETNNYINSLAPDSDGGGLVFSYSNINGAQVIPDDELTEEAKVIALDSIRYVKIGVSVITEKECLRKDGTVGFSSVTMNSSVKLRNKIGRRRI